MYKHTHTHVCVHMQHERTLLVLCFKSTLLSHLPDPFVLGSSPDEKKSISVHKISEAVIIIKEKQENHIHPCPDTHVITL